MQRKQQSRDFVVVTVHVGQGCFKGCRYEPGSRQRWLMDTQLVPADSGTTAGFVEANIDPYLFLRPTMQLTQLLDAFSND